MARFKAAVDSLKLWLFGRKFFADSDVSALKYIGDNSLSLAVRLFWTVAYAGSMAGLGLYLYEIFERLTVKPDVMTSEKMTLARNIPMPALTICPPLVADGAFINISKWLTASNEYEVHSAMGDAAMTSDEHRLLIAHSHACYDEDAMTKIAFTYLPESFGAFDEGNVAEILDAISPRSVLTFCFPQLNPLCEDVFLRVLTNKGYCFTFNTLDYESLFTAHVERKPFESYKNRKPWLREILSTVTTIKEEDFGMNWSLEGGFKDNKTFTHPLRILKTFSEDFYMRIRNDQFRNFCQERKGQYKIYFHLPNEIMSPLNEEISLHLDDLKELAITAHATHTDDSLRRFRPEERGCYYDHERKLKLFKHYTKDNCEYECLINYTLGECGCVKFSMPHDNATKICGFNDINCYHMAIQQWPENYFAKEFVDDATFAVCNCLQPCNDIKYSILNKETFELSEKNSFLEKSFTT